MSEGLNPFEPPKADAGAAVRWKILPYERFDLLTDLSPGEVLEELGDLIEPVRWLRFRWVRPRVPFEGSIVGSSFDCRFIAYAGGSSGTSRIRGVVMPYARGGSRIRGNISMATVNVVAPVGVLGLSLVLIAERRSGDISELAFPLVFVTVIVLLWTFYFWRDVKRARRLLIDRLEARPALPEEVGLE